MSIGPIPWNAIDQYGLSYGLNSAEREELFEVMSELDEEFLTWQSTKD